MSRHIVACGGGGWSSDGRIGPLEEHILGLTTAASPRVCLLSTASGDSDWVITRFYESFMHSGCVPSHLALFRAHPERAEDLLLSQDVIYVCGGSSANLLAIWEVHGIGPVLRRAWERGTVMSGVSAGAICWFAAGLTNSLGPGFAPIAGLGFLDAGFCPHADSDPGRLVALRGLIDAGAMPPTFAVDDGAAVHLEDGAPPRLISAEHGRGAILIGPGGSELPLTPLTLAG